MSDPRQRLSVLRHAWWVALLCLYATGATAFAAGHGRESCGGSARMSSLSAPTLEQAVDSGTATAPEWAFVQVVVAKISNPERIPISFEVHFHSMDGKKDYLGSFSPFPPDNPGTFIVATRGLLKAGGTVSVTLVALQPVSTTQAVYTCVDSITFIE